MYALAPEQNNSHFTLSTNPANHDSFERNINYTFTEKITAQITFVQRHVPRQTESRSSESLSRE